MKFLSESTALKNSALVYLVLFTLIAALSYLYWSEHITDQKVLAIISGLLTGLVVAVFQVALSVREMRQLDKFKSLGIVDVIATRDDEEYYRKLVQDAQDEIRIQGVTCRRFLNDFANLELSAPKKNRVLQGKLAEGLKVKILIAHPQFLEGDESKRSQQAQQHLKTLSEKYQNLSFGLYQHAPTHSIFTIDDHCIVGPSFPGVSSQFSPAIHLKREGRLASRYMEYFEQEWTRCTGENQAS
jgi:hypothetical protein